MAKSLLNLVDNIAEGLHKIKWKYKHDNDKSETCWIKHFKWENFGEIFFEKFREFGVFTQKVNLVKYNSRGCPWNFILPKVSSRENLFSIFSVGAKWLYAIMYNVSNLFQYLPCYQYYPLVLVELLWTCPLYHDTLLVLLFPLFVFLTFLGGTFESSGTGPILKARNEPITSSSLSSQYISLTSFLYRSSIIWFLIVRSNLMGTLQGVLSPLWTRGHWR